MRQVAAALRLVAFVVVSVSVPLFVTSGSAADLPRPTYKAPGYFSPAPVHNWTGLYVGAHAGYGGANLPKPPAA